MLQTNWNYNLWTVEDMLGNLARLKERYRKETPKSTALAKYLRGQIKSMEAGLENHPGNKK